MTRKGVVYKVSMRRGVFFFEQKRANRVVRGLEFKRVLFRPVGGKKKKKKKT